MNKKDQLEARIRGYLLGQLDESDERSFEIRLMDDDRLFREVDSVVDLVEDDLVEDYVQGELSDAERTAFELRFLSSPRIQQKLILTRAILRRATMPEPEAAVDRPGRPKVSRLRSWLDVIFQPIPALAALMFILLIGGAIWSTMKIDQLRSELDQMSSQRARQVETGESRENQPAVGSQQALDMASERTSTRQPSGSTKSAPGTPKGNPVPVVASMVLQPGLYRSGGEVGTLELSPQQGLVEFRLDLGLDEFPSYGVALFNAAGDEIAVEDGLSAQHEKGTVLITAQFPASLLRQGEYHIRLSGVPRTGDVEPLDLYYFRVR